MFDHDGHNGIASFFNTEGRAAVKFCDFGIDFCKEVVDNIREQRT